MNTSLSTEERFWSVLAHISALAFGMGILLPVVGWAEQRRKSKYASFQCLQALGYQSLGYTFWLLSYFLVFMGIMIAVIVMSYRAEMNAQPYDPFAGPLTTWISVITFGSLAIYMILPVVAAVACATGREFYYPLMGQRLAKYLGYEKTDTTSEWLIEEQEDRWVVAMGHFSVIVALWGLLAPLTTWVLQGKRNFFLKYQSVQTTLYQAGVTLLFFSGVFILLVIVATLPFTIWSNTSANADPSAGMAGLIFIFILMIIALIIFLVVPLFHILGQWAGYRVLKGDNYRYPIVGRIVERWITNKTPLAADAGLRMEGKSS